ncbi:hypothetical protein TSUD_56890 [Trifolium subterraneum]|uniref:Endonuclease/exonuclease/phosphatase domain-containing protein n=1 Tax=Trifolium subterraneum TaxID=3900 RepID=A0A2Z6NSF0_TRISU|nr:hypothetical protein TSUD_56890 [Trifolium subterraneum]
MGGDDVGWRCAPAMGRSGGIITMWDKNRGTLLDSFQGQGYLGVVLMWGVKKINCVIINVYASCLMQAKKALWMDLLVAMKVYGTTLYCILGDFNSVRSAEEMRGAKSKDTLEFQKSRSRWLKEGDANTGFFHACVKTRKRSNSIVALKKGRVWLSRPDEVRSEVVSYFRKHFEEVSWERPTLDGVEFLQI